MYYKPNSSTYMIKPKIIGWLSYFWLAVLGLFFITFMLGLDIYCKTYIG